MRIAFVLVVAATLLSSCGQSAPNPYPAEARTRFDASCPPESEVCACTWEGITRAMPYEEYESALLRFSETGSMDPKITRARTQCLERHSS